MAHAMTKEELDLQFEQFMKESVSDDSVDLGSSSKPSVLDSLGKAPIRTLKKTPVSAPWWHDDDDDDEDDDDDNSDRGTEKAPKRRFTKVKIPQALDPQVESKWNESPSLGLESPGKSFRKSLRSTTSIKEVDEEDFKQMLEDEKRNEVLSNLDNLKWHESELELSTGVPGLSTMEKEKETDFLSYLKKESSALSDSSKLIQEQKTSTPASSQRKEMDSLNEDQQKSDLQVASTPTYSDDFEEEASVKSNHVEIQKKKLEGRVMQAKDCEPPLVGIRLAPTDENLADGEETSQQEPAVHSSGQSGRSDMEALQEAYRQISDLVGDCEEGLAAGGRTPISPSTLQPVSTAESDLATCEELMRPIGPEATWKQGFALPPVIEASPQAGENPLRIFSEERPFSSANNGSEEDKAARLMEEDHTASVLHNQKNVASEIKRLMQEQESSSVKPPPVKPKTSQVPARSSVFTSVSSRKAPAPLVMHKKPEIASSPTAPAPGRTNRAAKAPSLQRIVHSQASKKNPILSQTQTIRASDPSLKLSSELVESVQSLTTLLQRQVESSSSQPSTGVLPHAKSEHQVMKEDNDDRSNTPQERTSLEGFRLQLAQKERELCLREEQLQKKHKQEMDTLSQENYVLKSKLHSAEETSKKAKFDFGNVSDPVTEEKLRLLKKDMKEQEALIQGYQKENEKLCLQMKAMQAKGKETEEALFMENQRLISELSLSRGRMNMDSIQRAPGGKSFSEPNSRNEELTGQIQAAQRNQMRLEDEIRRLKQEKQVMYVDLEKMMKERDLAKTQALNTSGDKSLELRLLQEKHQEEVTELKKRLQWYAENQELLNKDAARLRAATVETQKLSEQVERMKIEVSRRASEHLMKTKERAGDAKRIHDLEQKLKQMEELLKQRHPNSLPALILAAASAEENVGSPVASETTALLEKRIHRLEAELEGRDEEAKSSLRMMEQQFHKIKLQYEDQIANLEQRLAEKSRIDQVLSSPLPDSQAQRLMAELEELKKVDGEKESALQMQIASLKEQLQQAQSVVQLEKPARSPSRHQLQAEAAQATRIERLTQELNTKTRTVQELTRTVERLQKERRTMLSGPVVNQEPKLHLAAAKAAKHPAVKSFPSNRDEKDYHPGDFSGLDISEVQLENASLRERLEQMEIQREKERVSLQASITYAQNQVLRVQEQNAEQLSSVKAEHRKEIERILACHAMEHSSSKVAELTNSLNTQEIIVQHLQRQVKELQSSRDALVVSKAREEALQNQLAKLLGELKQAKAAQSPELKHFTSLEQKIQFMELRYDQREQQLHQVITDARKVMEQESRGEVERWKRVAQGRAKELETFRLELDSILDVLRELQRQGVVIPVPERTSTSTHTYLPLPP